MLLTVSLLAALVAGPAQTAPTTPKQQRAANRQALRDASRTDAPYKDSHLTVTPEQLQRGNTAGPPGAANLSPPPPNYGRPHHRPRRKAKTEPTP